MSEKSIIVAHDKDRAIGKNGEMPWQGKLPAELQHFKERTLRAAVIMGRVTCDSLTRPLVNRQNIVLSRQTDYERSGFEVTASLEEAFDVADANRDIFIIGGEQIYERALPLVNNLVITKIQHRFDGDRFFPEINQDEWELTNVSIQPADERNKYSYEVHDYTRAQ